MKRAIIIILILLVCGGTKADNVKKSDINIGAAGSFGYVFKTFPDADRFLDSNIYPAFDIRIGRALHSEADGPYAQDYNYPNVGLGLTWSGMDRMKFKGSSYLKPIWSLYGFFERDIVRNRIFSFGYELLFGFGLTSGVYDAIDNPMNTVFGGPLSFCIGMAPYISVMPASNLEIGLNARLRHHSFARLAFPNHGINEVMPTLYLRYHIQEPYSAKAEKVKIKAIDKGFKYNVFLGGGVHYCTSDWNSRGKASVPWPKFFAGFNVSYRYALKFSSGLGFDAFWTTRDYMNNLKECDELMFSKEEVSRSGRYNPFSCGLFARQNFHYGHFSIWAGVGVYIFKQYGIQEQLSRLYQKVGLEYEIQRLGISLSIDCKAHYFSRAEMLEFTITKPLYL